MSEDENITADGVVPQQIGRYQIKSLLGEGAMGRVYLAHDPSLHRDVALKTLRPVELSPDARQRYRKRFENEARAAAGLVHPHIVQVYDVGEESTEGPFLVFEYVEGETLRSYLRREGRMELPEVVVRVRALAEAVDTAHRAKILHRDIKPENILVTPSGDVKLADFGIARVPNASLTREGQFLGTPAYAAPETLGHGLWSERSDLFSLVCVAFEMLTGTRAFPGTGAVEVANSIIHGDTPLPSRSCPGAGLGSVDPVFRSGFAKAPKERFATAGDFVQALEEKQGKVSPDTRSAQSSAIGPWIVFLLGGSLITWALVAQCGVAPQMEPDAGVEGDSGIILEVDSAPRDADALSVRDAVGARPASAPLDGAVDAESDASESVDNLTGHEREEIAKDALSEARGAIEEGALQEAEEFLLRAETYDPGNTDIRALRLRLDAARSEEASPQNETDAAVLPAPQSGSVDSEA